jgi:flagellar M-ring protein FliF
MIGLAASVAVGFGVVLWSQEPDFRPLFTDLSHMDANQVTSILTSEQIQYKLDTDKGLLLVESAKIHQARMRLASAGVSTSQGAGGYELLDKGSALGTSQFMEKARYKRSVEGELARTISSLRSVKSARVHLAIPKRSVFITDRRKPRASVLVDLFPGSRLTEEQVASVVHLVASSITELDAKQVTVVDQNGNFLSESDGNSDIARANKNYEYTRNMEKKFLASINNILEPILGEAGFKVEVTADVDFTKEEQTAEQFNPDLAVVRSEKIMEEQSGIGELGGVPGAVANQPPAAGQAPEVGAAPGAGGAMGQDQRVSRQSLRNFEVDRTISYTKRQVGQLRRLSVAVVVDDLAPPPQPADPNNNQAADPAAAAPVRTPVPAAMMENITQLVKDAVGYDPRRGDRVVVLNQAFRPPEAIPDIEMEPVPIWEADWFAPTMKMAFGWLIAIIVMMAVLRPVLRNLSAFSQSAQSMEMTMPELPPLEEPEDSIAQNEVLLPGPEESYEAQLNAVKSMVAEDPRRVAQVVKTWLSE